ncbi:bifunctional 5,10-methylenetetrahydrofolate dehydrogenase/5,10-methenyltetrahydrofolate cyclohydrolase [Steroidobacter sp.]|uniref:bifunctional 5,10-methylenetetrahydrofolate dehydrogenase/5,10-methenyltetrahydrofolate cyclohydrolase n=1 Tax=Steroidobacter sp. TaxID=1978227 RepID=UPI0025E56D7D|nr:tetrahydrofolate dehydrogenase/cyclohydrolase catalytic domain-containing protein [Steroidobacter sp.]
MSARIIDGVKHAKQLRAGLAAEISEFERSTGVRPKLTVVLVGSDAASRLYVSNKAKACRDVGIESATVALPASVTLPELLAVIDAANEDKTVHGILVQLPLPAHLPVRAVLERISVDKDVDGFHMYNVGGLVVGSTVFSPCTPYGVQKLLEAEQIPIAGQNVVVVGASNIVGKPTALMLMQKDATVCICHAKTRDLAQFTILADILVVAAGRPNLILAPMVKTGAVVIDVGINRLPDGRIVGDVDFEAVRLKASHITPVPGGVGPMTITMLLHNTLVAARALSGQ